MQQMTPQIAKFLRRCGDAPVGMLDEHIEQHVSHHYEQMALGVSLDNTIRVERQGGVAKVYVSGTMMPKAEWFDEISTQELALLFDQLTNDDTVNMVIMDLDTPGGSTLGHANLIDSAERMAASKKVIAYASTMCCSAGYWLAMTADEFTAAPGSIIGSIGVRNHLYDYSQAFKEAGIKVIDIASGPLKSTGLPGTEVTQEQIDDMTQRVMALFEQFKAAVLGSRKMTVAQQSEAFKGGVFYADDALRLNLIDGLSKQATPKAAPRGTAISKPLAKGTTMSDQVTQEPKAASTGELKKHFPNSTAEWREQQTESGATLSEAAIEYAKFQESQAEEARQAVAEAEAKAAKLQEDAEKAAAKKDNETKRSTRGVTTTPAANGEEEGSDELDFKAIAKEYQAKRQCRWSEATLAIKKKYGREAIEFFNGPPEATVRGFREG